MKGSGIIELFLWLFTFIGGVFYSIWRRSGPRNTCPVCKTESLIAAHLANPRATQGTQQVVVRAERECPHCAEMILSKAKTCKHCGKAV